MGFICTISIFIYSPFFKDTYLPLVNGSNPQVKGVLSLSGGFAQVKGVERDQKTICVLLAHCLNDVWS